MLPLENLTVGQLLHRTAQRHPHCPAVWYNGLKWDYRCLEKNTELAAQWLLASGAGPGEHIALWGELDPEMLLLFYAIQMIGSVAVMLNTSLGRGELDPLLEKAQVRRLFVGRSYKHSCHLARLSGAESFPPCVQKVHRVQDYFSARLHAAHPENCAAKAALRQAEDRVRPEDTAVILFTSGSSGTPKAVCSSHFSRVNGGIQQADDLHATSEDRFCVTMPAFHCFCISANLMASLAVGGCLCIPQDRHTASITAAIEQCGCTVLSSVPTMFHALIGKKAFVSSRLSTLRTGIIGGAFYPPEEFVQIEQALGPQFRLLSSLGQTETTAGMTICNMEDSLLIRSTTVGHFMNHVEGKIVDIQTGLSLPAGQQGEICVRGYLNMQGYYNDPVQTSRVLDKDGWIHTGDLGILDSQGNIALRGRIKELIIRGGENISPCEIEEVLLKLPQVAQCKVVSVPDAHYGEEICACIRLAPEMPANEADMKLFLLRHLAEYKLPRYFLYWDKLPETASGKISAALCAQQARKQLQL